MSLIAKQLLIHNIGLPTEISMLVKDYTFPRINKIPQNDRRYLNLHKIIVKLKPYSPSRLYNFMLPDGIDINEINYYVCLRCPRSQESDFEVSLVQSFCLIYTDLAIIMIKWQFINSRNRIGTFVNSKNVIAMHIKN